MHSKLFLPIATCLLIILGCDPSESVPSGTYDVKSDCPDAKTSGELVVESDFKFDSGGSKKSYEIDGATEFGFPSEKFVIMGPHKIQSNGNDRVCQTMVFENTLEFAFYACTTPGGGDLICMIYLERQ